MRWACPPKPDTQSVLESKMGILASFYPVSRGTNCACRRFRKVVHIMDIHVALHLASSVHVVLSGLALLVVK